MGSNEIKWIKLSTDMFNDEKVKIIESMEDGQHIINTWIRILCLTGKCNNNGVLTVSNNIPYTDVMLASVFNETKEYINTTLKIFIDFGMMYVIEEGGKEFYALPNWAKHQSADALESKRERDREYQRVKREAQKNAISQKSSDKSSDSRLTNRLTSDDNSSDKSSDTLKDIIYSDVSNSLTSSSLNNNKEKGVIGEKEKEERKKKQEEKNILMEKIMDSFNENCPSLPKVLKLTPERKTAIGKLLKEGYTFEDFEECFKKAEDSDFLCRRGQKNDATFRSDFDWIITAKGKFQKILEGSYDNKTDGKKYQDMSSYLYNPDNVGGEFTI